MKILKKEGYHDGYYWDYRVLFKYNGRIYSFINVGSGSGYVPCHKSIAYDDIITNALHSSEDELLFDNFYIDERELIEAANKLNSSGENELTSYEENDW